MSHKHSQPDIKYEEKTGVALVSRRGLHEMGSLIFTEDITHYRSSIINTDIFFIMQQDSDPKHKANTIKT